MFIFKFMTIQKYTFELFLGSQAPPTSLILNNNMGGQQSYQLIMDPRMGLVVGAINNPPPPPPATQQKVYQGKVQVNFVYTF